MKVVELVEMIESAIPNAKVRAVDLQGGGDHFEVSVVSEQFEGRSLIERHRMIYTAVGEAMQREIHALTIRVMSRHEEQALARRAAARE